MKYLSVFLIVFVAAIQPQLLVNLEFSSTGEGQITSFERSEGDDPTRIFGSWTLQLRSQDLLVTQTQFSPEIIDGEGNREYVDELTIPILLDARAKTIELVDSQGTIVDVYPISTFCGDGLCEISERSLCRLDCAPEGVQQVTLLDETPLVAEAQSGNSFWILVISIVILIFVLLLVLIHFNKKR